ncbi:hypothetical protein SAMN02746041_02195 [Desulfacinum hydrothermale DSM 13146]|uniref:Transposase DDE domain-containing protein n=1 Tax=Desulfacinum hydrothermale DSM 13146 TaxID=1121390 RepID=A0A1W1XMF0_9BACT|nr:hypothetical protein SAMN02746041_02195 [Desulfacinum hydrothermale DSM 13146]
MEIHVSDKGSLPVNNFKDAQKRVEWYSARRGIEVYHRPLKSGCRIKNRQLASADGLQSCLGIDMVAAWRIYHLTMLGREAPVVPCERSLERSNGRLSIFMSTRPTTYLKSLLRYRKPWPG